MPDGNVLGKRQTPAVTIRTWAIGLLVGLGCAWREAERQVNDGTGLGHISQAGFNVDRARLLERAPEAERCLYQRGRRQPK